MISGVQNQRVLALELNPMPLKSIFENFLDFLETGLYIIMDIEKAMSLNSSQTFISNDFLLKIFRNKNSANHHFQHFRTTI